ncbi:DUF2232 domain-containing protein [Roseicella frigidaeris]|uniref:DUF2232 domain-containing protein n=1 Tax=Roseicella frigidaeris TaxID=2230885 RepID=A0A327MBI1_9PROT|nr:DUF2232 domain-containing protein [Roseicella frigidaeris]RAI59514.1 hypothetical protein DOO78_07895 [Roseicella frigidaeris]
MGAVTATGPQGQGQGQTLSSHPGLLAAGAAGCISALCALWAMRGLPLGTGVFWLASFPLFAAGLGFGPASAVAAGLLALLLVAVSAGGFAALIYLVLFGVPAPLLVAAAFRSGPGIAGPGGGQGGRFGLSLPLALLGLWPLAVLFGAAVLLADDGGLEAALRETLTLSLARFGLPAQEALVAELVRVKAGAIGFWGAVSLLANAGAATAFLARRNLLPGPKPDWAAVRLPNWYPLLPGAAFGLFLAAPEEGDLVALSALLLLLVPLFLQGLAGVHRRLRGRQGRRPMLVAFYLLLVLFLQVIGPGLVALGLYDQIQRRQAPRQS